LWASQELKDKAMAKAKELKDSLIEAKQQLKETESKMTKDRERFRKFRQRHPTSELTNSWKSKQESVAQKYLSSETRRPNMNTNTQPPIGSKDRG
jgi:hypothetical protein